MSIRLYSNFHQINNPGGTTVIIAPGSNLFISTISMIPSFMAHSGAVTAAVILTIEDTNGNDILLSLLGVIAGAAGQTVITDFGVTVPNINMPIERGAGIQFTTVFASALLTQVTFTLNIWGDVLP